MGEAYVLRPEPAAAELRYLLEQSGAMSVAPEGLAKARIDHILICPKSRRWTIHLAGEVGNALPSCGTVERAIASGVPGVDEVVLRAAGSPRPPEPPTAPPVRLVAGGEPLAEPEFEPEAEWAEPLAAEPAPASLADPEPDPEEDYMRLIMEMARTEALSAERPTGAKRPATSAILLGSEIKQPPQRMDEITDEERSVVVQGEVFGLDVRELRSGRTMISFDFSDGTDSLTAKLFATEEEESLADQLREGLWLRARGPVQYDKFTQELTLLPRDVMVVDAPPERMDTSAEKRVELHLHTKMSALDGAAEIEDVIELAAKWGHPAIAITDHGVVQAFPRAAAAGKQHGIKILYGTEGYLVNDPDKSSRQYHIVLFAKNQIGLQNLYRLVSIAHTDYFYRRPRIPRQVLEQYRSGLVVGSACEAGELYQAVLSDAPDDELDRIASFYDYVEIQPLANTSFLIENGKVPGEKELEAINRRIVEVGRRVGKPVVATGDVHFIKPEHDVFRRIIMAGHGFTDLEQPTPLYLRTTDEMLAEFAYLGEEEAYRVVVSDPRSVADSIDELQPIPDGFHPPHLEGAEDEIRQMAQTRAEALYGSPLPELVAARLGRELDSIIGNGYASLYLIAHKLVKRSLDDGYMVGSRGSVGSSLVANLCYISEVNPLPPHYRCLACHYFEVFDDGTVGAGPDLPPKACPTCTEALVRDGFDIPFETFLGFQGDKVPDIDLNFSGEYQSRAHKYAEELFGKENLFRAGTISTLKERTAYGYVRKFLDDLGKSPRTAEVNRLVKGITGVRRTTGQHPGGLMVVPKGRDIHEFTPIQHPANDRDAGTTTTHFDFNTIHDQLVKLDILGHDGPTVLRMLEDLTGVKAMSIPLDDPDTMAIFSGLGSLGIDEKQAFGSVGTLGIPEYGTGFVRQMLADTRPETFADLVRIMGLSHGTDVWLNNAQELVRKGIVTLSETIAARDDIMIYLIRKGLEPVKAFAIMEQVRKGRGLKEDDVEAMKANNVPNWYIESCQRISYMFPKAHAVAYAVMAFYIAFFKVHHPQAFYATYFTIKGDDCDAGILVQGEKAIRQALQAIERKGNEASAKEKSVATVLEVAGEAVARGTRFLPVAIYDSDARRFLIEPEGLRCPLASLPGVGVSAAESIVTCRAEKPFTSQEDIRKRSKVTKTVIQVLGDHGCLGDLPESDQLSLF